MNAFFSAALAVILLGYASSLVLENYQHTVDVSNVGAGARPDPEPKLRPPVPGLPKS